MIASIGGGYDCRFDRFGRYPRFDNLTVAASKNDPSGCFFCKAGGRRRGELR